jgi:TPP-dependent pyruvate/acetoin dehydrogenase alpha subunit
MNEAQERLASDRQSSVEWRLYKTMLTTRLFEEALVRWEHEGKHAAQTFPSKGQEAIAAGTCAALQKGDDVLPSFRTRGAMIAMGVSVGENFFIRRVRWATRATRRIMLRGRNAVSCPAPR